MSRPGKSAAECRIAVLAAFIGMAAVNIARAEPLALFEPAHRAASIFDPVVHDPATVQPSDLSLTAELPARTVE